MSEFFVRIYDYFTRHRAVLYLTLGGLLLVLAGLASQVRFSEDVTTFFPDDETGRRHSLVFENLRLKDKIVIMFSAADTLSESDPDRLIAASERFEELLRANADTSRIRSIVSEVSGESIAVMTDMVYDRLPIYLTEEDYRRMDSLMAGEGVEQTVEADFARIVSPVGGVLSGMLTRDPFSLGGRTLAAFQNFGRGGDYELYGNRLFTSGLETLLVFIDPMYGSGSTGRNDALVEAIEEAAAQSEGEFDGQVSVDYYGGPCVAVYNARQIKRDTMITLNIALLLVIVVITFAFSNRWAVPLIVLPVVFGGIFALAAVWLLQGHISSIALGAGAAVFGIALSYSIHVLSHSNHTSDMRQVIRELAYPLTVGSFTTIGAFLGLLFTSSSLLRDFGLFSAFVLIGTTLFCLVFLPHFIRSPRGAKPNRLYHLIERVNGYAYDRNRWLVGGLAVVTLVCLFFYNDVGFDSDMMRLNYEPRHIREAEQRLAELTDREDARTVLFISTGEDPESACRAYGRLTGRLRTLQENGKIGQFASVGEFLVPESVQRERIERWNTYWTPERRETLLSRVETAALGCGFRPGAFDSFRRVLERDYRVEDPLAGAPQGLFDDWVARTDSMTLLLTQVTLSDSNREAVYGEFADDPATVIADRSYFAGKMAEQVNDDFYLILYISSLLIFAALLLSYGRIELALMAFLPMSVSWVIILGLMALFGIEFNIVNIILSTFIFGIGDDFSIFIMDGLLSEYRTGKRLLPAHKTAIFFSAFTTVAGMGAMVFARHPALHSISLISILGMAAVVLVAFTIQPILFRLFISSQTARGGFPYTLMSLLNTLYAFLYFVTGCFVLQGILVPMLLIPVSARRKRLWFHRMVRWSTHTFLRTMITTKAVWLNEPRETFARPGVVIANHQSFIDILMLLSLYPKLVMVTNSWVWKSPFFGRIVRYCGCYHTADGYESLADTLRDKIEEGYSVVIFPEGTRSPDGKIGRFHKGAFYLAEKLQLDLIPILLYGNGLISSKRQPFYIKKGYVVSSILPRIAWDDPSFGTGYKERTKRISAWFRNEYEKLYERFNAPDNAYFYDALIKNYTYKGPVLEWYMRVKVRMERNYALFHRLVPRAASVVDVGCGYGPLAFMLSMLSEKRRILGVDYDSEKIAVAEHGFLRNERIRFVCADAAEYDFPEADVFILNDVLHYLDYEAQERLLERCIARLAPGGLMIVRDGDASKTERQRVTELTERISTRIVGFNKTQGELCFTSTDRLLKVARRHGLFVRTIENDRITSNTIYLFTRYNPDDGTV